MVAPAGESRGSEQLKVHLATLRDEAREGTASAFA